MMKLKSAHTAKIGKVFQNARNLSSMNQKEVAEELLINVEYIKAIESGDYSIFPARIFAIQYFKRYSKFLDLKIDFFDIYNADVAAAAKKEAWSNAHQKTFFKKLILKFKK